MVAALRRENGVSFAGNEFSDTTAFASSLRIASSNAPDHNTGAEERLRDALKIGDMHSVADILNGGSLDINWTDSENGFSFLHYAATGPEGERAFEYLVKAGIDVSLTDSNGKTATQLYNDRYTKSLQDSGFNLDFIKYGTGAAKWILDKATEEIETIAAKGLDTVGDFKEVNKWAAAGGSLIPIMPKVSLFDALHLRPEDQVKFVMDILGNDGRVQQMIDDGEIDPDALMNEEVNGVKPYEFYKTLADNEEIAEEDRKRFGEIADVLKDKKAPGSEEPETPDEPTEEPEETPTKPVVGPLGPDTQIPDDDTRTAEQIASDSKVYSQLHEKDRKDLLDFIGKDVKDERRKVYLAVAALNHIEHFNEKGEAISPTGEGRIDGWTRADRNDSKSHAQNGTESGRFQDLLKHGWGNLKGDSLPNGMPPEFEEPPENLTPSSPDEKEAQDIVKSSALLSSLSKNDKDALKSRIGNFEADPKKARLAIEVLNHIERYDEAGKPIRGGSTIGNGRIDGWTRADRNDPKSEAEHGTEAGRFQDFIKYGWDSLKTETNAGEVADIEELEKLAEGVGDDFGKYESFIKKLKEHSYYSIISEAGLPADKRDFIANPDKYSTEERGAAVLELMVMRERVENGLGSYSEYGVVYGSNRFGQGDFQLHSDPAKVIGGINDAINKLANDEVGEWIETRETEALQEIVGSSPELRDFVRGKVDTIRDDAWKLDSAIDKDGDIIENLGTYISLATTMNLAAGESGKPYEDNLIIDIRDSSKFDEITGEYEKKLGNDTVLKELIDGGMSEDEAMAEINSRAAIFSYFGSPLEDLADSVNANIRHYYLSTTDGQDLVGIILDDEGNLDEKRINEIIDEIRANDPDSAYLHDDSGQPLSNTQIITGVRNGWDSFRAGGKWNHSLNKFGSGFMADSNPIKQVYGYGGMHFISGLLAGGAMISKGASGDTDGATVAGLVGSAMQVIGLAGETSALQTRTDGNQTRIENLRAKWNKQHPATQRSPQAIERAIGNLTDASRLMSATGGTMILGASIAMAIEEAQKGNPAGAVVYATAGAANFATAPTAFMQSLGPNFLKNKGWSPERIAQRIGKIALWGGRLGTITNPIAFFAMLGYELFAGIKEDQKTEAYFESFTPTLYEYNINGGDDPWWDEDDGPTIGS